LPLFHVATPPPSCPALCRPTHAGRTPPSRRRIAPTPSPLALSLAPPSFSSLMLHRNVVPPVGATAPQALVREVPLDVVKLSAHVCAHLIHRSRATLLTHPPVRPSPLLATSVELPSPATYKTGVYRFPLSMALVLLLVVGRKRSSELPPLWQARPPWPCASA
jgi:hypothetical protein